MKTKIQLLLSLCLLFAGREKIVAQDITNRGKDFWVGYGHHQYMEDPANNSQEMVLYFSAEQAANVKVTIKGKTATTELNYSVPANSVIASDFIPKSGPLDVRLYDYPPSFGGNGSEGVFAQSIHIVSDVPIVAYAHIFGSVSSGATMLMPVESWGYSYMSINSQQADAGGPAFSWVYAIAQHDNTVIEVIPSANTWGNKPAGIPYNITLNKGEIYQFIGQSDGDGNGSQFTGSRVKSIANAAGECYPVAVFSGSSRTRGESVPCVSSSGRDNDMQQCFPIQAWGKRYLTAPFSSASTSFPSTNINLQASTFQTSVYKVVVNDPATVVKKNGVALTGLINGKYYQFSSKTADYIEADKPVMIAQFMSGSRDCNPGTLGDPEMVFLSPVEQAIKSVGFYRNTRELISANYVTVIIPTNGMASLLIDGSNSFNHSYPHPNLPGYSIVVKGWPAAQSQVLMSSDSAFTAITYGLGGFESYAYNAGTYLKNLNAVASIQNTPDPSVQEHPYTCVGTPVKLSVLMAYQPTKIDWLLSQVPALSPNADITVNGPVSTGTVLVNGVTYYKYTLPGDYTFSAADTFFIPVNGYNDLIENCYKREKFRLPVIVKPNPVADFSFTHSGCTLDTATFTGSALLTNGSAVSQYNWTFPGPATYTGQVQLRTLPPGEHVVKLSVVTADGCADDTTRRITVYEKSSGLFEVTPVAACPGQPFTMTDTSSSAIPVNKWYWDFGNGNVQTVTTGPSVTYAYPAPGTYTIRHVGGSSATCISDTISKVVTVYQQPAVSFANDAAGCLIPSGLVNFAGTATTTDGQTIISYEWNFGDANANAGNPNTSTAQNPSHNFQQGTYTITLTATTANGCTASSTQTITFNLRPVVDYYTLPAVCENASPVSVATATVTNNVPGTGVYSGPGTTAAGMFDPAAAGAGTHTITYTFTSSNGCVESVGQTIRVYAKPAVSFTNDAAGCLAPPGVVNFTGTVTTTDGQVISSYAWDFGDGHSSNVQNPSHNFQQGTYTVTLTATTANGCAVTSTQTITFNLEPVLSYSALPAICANASPVSVATATVTNAVPGTGVYSGPGTTAAGMFDPAAAGAGTHTITYTFTSSNGCVESVGQTIRVYAKPAVSFTSDAAGCLAPPGSVNFTGTATTTDGQAISSYAWDFGDSHSSNAQNPSHNFQQGTYTVTLTGTTVNGCAVTSTQIITFNLQPALDYPVLPAVCENASPVSIANAVVTNAVPGTGVYSGLGTTEAGMFDPAVAGAGTHTITYTFTSTAGCVKTASNTIIVHPKPVAAFTVNGNNGVCLGESVTFTDGSSIASGSITNWNWQLGDGNTPSYTNGNPFTVTYTAADTYTTQLITISDKGCTSLPVTKNIRVSPVPVVSFTTPGNICMPGGNASFTNNTTVADNSGLTYSWNFGDGNSSVAVSPGHVYNNSGSYTVTLTATSAFGCVQQGSVVVDDFYDKPVAAFDVLPRELCQGADNVFTDKSAAPNSTIRAWKWDFDDGSNAAIANPVKRFNRPGTFDVSLVVTNTAGCVSDPFVLPVMVHLQPVIDAGPSYTVPAGTTIQLKATANSAGLTFSWSPAVGLSDAAVLNPVLTATLNQTYTLTATGDFGCTAKDAVTVKILQPVKVPNVFSPNGDNIHDQWQIPNLMDYPGCTVEVFNRHGQQVYYSAGYGTPWNGTYKGKDVPVGTYYYIIKLENGFKPLAGSLTILR